jgi:hypothetical protein
MGLKILTGWPLEDQQTGLYVISALKAMGHLVTNVDPKVIYRAAMLSGKEVEPLVYAAMEAAVHKSRPDAIFISRQGWFTRFAKAYKNKIPVGGWNVDVRYDPEGEWSSLLELIGTCSHWFTIAAGNVPWYRENVNPSTHWLSEGCEPIVHTPPNDNELKVANNNHMVDTFRAPDVTFAGSISTSHTGPPRVELLRALDKEFSLRVYGAHNNTYLVNKDHSMMAYCSSINLGHSGWPNVSLSQSARDYRVMAAGGFLLTNSVRHYDEFFIDGVHFDRYTTIEDCIDKIKYYNNNPNVKQAIANAGYLETHHNHTFTHRLSRAISIMSGGDDFHDGQYEEWSKRE